MDIGDVLSQSWKIIWKHKVLWIFGLLAGCGTASTSTGNGGVTYQVDAPTGLEQYFADLDPGLVALYAGLGILIGLIVLILVIFLGTVGRVALIRGTKLSHEGAARLTFGELFSASTPYFWRVFGLTLLVAILAFVVVTALIIIGVVGSVFTLGLGLLCLIPFLCLLIPILWLVTIFVEQSVLAIVLEDLGIMDGMRRGWEVFRLNIGSMLGLGIILLVLSLVVAFLIGLPFLATGVPLLTGLFYGTSEALTTGLVVTAIAVLCYLPFFLLLNGILRSYTGAAWTLNYLRLTRVAAVAPAPAAEEPPAMEAGEQAEEPPAMEAGPEAEEPVLPEGE